MKYYFLTGFVIAALIGISYNSNKKIKELDDKIERQRVYTPYEMRNLSSEEVLKIIKKGR